jgi:dihydroxyacid dehydratase/phosphogluconate dehydratase
VLRSAEWFGKRDRDGFIHRSWMRAEGFAPDVFDGRPVIGICNSWSELTSCNVHLRRVAESVKRGVWEAGGWPLEFPTISLGETYMRPTTMLFRNLMSMDVEESIRANPVDGVVLLSGCDKTTPAQLMGAASVDLPAIMVTGGPMLNGKYRGQDHDLPLLVNLQPSGRFLMEDFYYAGGVPAVVRELGDLIHRDALTVSGKSIGEATADAPCWNREVIATLAQPVKERAGIAILRGNLAPNGAVIKPSAATPALLTHRGRAVVFEDIEEYKARIDDPDLDVDETCVLVLKGAGPRGYPGMPEVGNLPLPPKILAKGVTDMVRISDARMSGTAYGTVVLHTSPEAAVGGTLALVQNGDAVELDVPNRRLELRVDDAELDRRRAAWRPQPAAFERGYAKLYTEHVLGAERGADFDFLVGGSGSKVAREMH